MGNKDKANATSFKPGNIYAQMIRDNGRPEFWTEEKAIEIADKLNEWMIREDSICLAGFRSEEALTLQNISKLKIKSPVFRDAYELAQATVANRLAQNAGKGVHVVHYNKYQAAYDPEIRGHEIEMITEKAKAEAASKDPKDSPDYAALAAVMKEVLKNQSS